MYYGGLYQHAFDFGTRFCAFMQLCNTLGVACVLSVSAIYILSINGKLDTKLAWLLMGGLSIIGCATLSKNFAITFAITAIFIFVNEVRVARNRKKVFKNIIIVFAIISPMILYYGLIMIDRFFGDATYANIIDNITTGRLEKWLMYLKPWCKNFWSVICGLGLSFNYNTSNSSHSLFVGYLSRLGIIGFVVLLVFVYAIVLRHNQSKLKFKHFPFVILCIICLAEDLSFNTFNFIPFIVAIMPIMVCDKAK